MVHHMTPPNALASLPHASTLVMATEACVAGAHSLLVPAPVQPSYVDQPPRGAFQM